MKNKVKEFCKTLYTTPLSEQDMEAFGNELIEEFVEELRKHQRTVYWNYGLDSVIFENKLDEIKEDFCGNGDNKGDSDESLGTGAGGNCKEDQPLQHSDQ